MAWKNLHPILLYLWPRRGSAEEVSGVALAWITFDVSIRSISRVPLSQAFWYIMIAAPLVLLIGAMFRLVIRFNSRRSARLDSPTKVSDGNSILRSVCQILMVPFVVGLALFLAFCGYSMFVNVR
jgi:hypothetical protein